jgi:HEAT repeat protein
MALREHLAAAVAEVVVALDEQAAVAPRPTPELIEALGGASSPPARAAAASALGQRRATEAVGPLCRVVRSGDAAAEAAAQSLAAIGDDRAVPCLLDWGRPDAARMGFVVRALAAMSGPAARQTLEGLASSAGDGEVRRLAAASLAAAVRPPTPSDGHDEAEHEVPSALKGYIDALADPDREVRVGAARALGEKRAALAVEPLCGLLERSADEEAGAALEALATIGDPRAVPCLARWGSEDARRILLAIPALALIGGPDAMGVLEMLRDSSEVAEVRRLAAAALADMRRREAAAPAPPEHAH